jgi:hypothetical protein
MDVAVLGIMIPIITVVGLFTMIVYLRKYENTERMAIIEKGLNGDMFKRDHDSSSPLRFSLLLIGGGLGLLMGYWLDKAFDMEEVAYFSMILLFGGLGLGAAYLVEEKKAKQNQR